MPTIPLILIIVAALGSALMIGLQIKTQLRRARNRKHFEKGEPLEGVGDLD